MFTHEISEDQETLWRIDFRYEADIIKTVFVSQEDSKGLAQEIKDFYNHEVPVYKRLIDAYQCQKDELDFRT